MKKNVHPPYQDVLFVDTATGTKFVCGSTLQPKATEMYEGKEYPVYHVPISSASHPFFTGSQQFVDSEKRVDKFKKRYERKNLINNPMLKEGQKNVSPKQKVAKRVPVKKPTLKTKKDKK